MISEDKEALWKNNNLRRRLVDILIAFVKSVDPASVQKVNNLDSKLLESVCIFDFLCDVTILWSTKWFFDAKKSL